ncbi:MAG: hypothetical protein AABO41_01950 [Acidobacteriota bacterium]
MRKLRARRSLEVVESASIKKQGSYFYTRAYWQVVVVLTLVYGGMGAVLAILTESDLEDVLEQIIFPIMAFVPVLMMWSFYAVMLWAFRREADTAIEVSDDGIRETRKGRERRFIPWDGVREIELNADLIGGMSLKVKGAFSEIAISNVDLEITRPMSFAKMHQALSRASEMLKLFGKLKSAAPQAVLRTNKLARRRLSEYALVDG